MLPNYRAIADNDIPQMSTEEIVSIYTPLVKSIAKQIISRCPANVEFDDLLNVGVIGLMDAADRFSPAYGKPFRFYAELRIRGEILDELRSNDWVPRSTRKKFEMIDKARNRLEKEKGDSVSDTEVADSLGLALEKLQKVAGKAHSGNFLSIEDLGSHDDDHKDLLEVMQGDSPDPDSVLRARELGGVLADAIRELPQREKIMILLYYYQELSLKEIGHVLGVTESRVSQMHTKALSRLKRNVGRYRLEHI